MKSERKEYLTSGESESREGEIEGRRRRDMDAKVRSRTVYCHFHRAVKAQNLGRNTCSVYPLSVVKAMEAKALDRDNRRERMRSSPQNRAENREHNHNPQYYHNRSALSNR